MLLEERFLFDIVRGCIIVDVFNSRFYFIAIALGATHVLCSPLEAQWLVRPDLPSAVVYNATVGVSTDSGYAVYSMGGNSSKAAYDSSVYQYLPSRNSWKRVRDMPTAKQLACVGVARNKIFVLGGRTRSGVTNSVEIYDPKTDTWTSGAPMPVGVCFAPVGVWRDGLLYVFGGSTSPTFSTATDTIQIYNVLSNVWFTATTGLPVATRSHGGGIINDTIFLSGGYNPNAQILSSSFIGSIEPTNPASIAWRGAPVYPRGPVSRVGSIAIPALDRFLFVGGDDGTTTLRDVYAFNLRSEQWEQKSQFPIGIKNLSMLALSPSTVIVGGGYDGTSIVKNVYSIDLAVIADLKLEEENRGKNFFFDIYPVPAHDEITVAINGSAGDDDVVISIADVFGRTVSTLRKKWYGNDRSFVHVSVSGFESGIYFCRIETSRDRSARQFLVIH